MKDLKGNVVEKKDAVLLLDSGPSNKKMYGNVNDPDIVKDEFSGEYMYKKSPYAKSFVTEITNGGVSARGYFFITGSKWRDVGANIFDAYVKKSPDGNKSEMIPAQILATDKKMKEWGFVEDLNSGMFYYKTVPAGSTKLQYEKFHYPQITSVKDKFIFGTTSPTNIISSGKNYTFGVEIETCGGFIPNRLRNRLNIDCQYDGSIYNNQGEKGAGGEYTTGVLYGDNGFKHLYEIMYELSRRCIINHTCSIHVHIGNIFFNKETVVLMYKLFEMLEGEMFDMMPPSRRVREHCRPMKKLAIKLADRGVPYDIMINYYYSEIFNMISTGHRPSKQVNKKLNHPRGKTCGWDRSTPRYWWVNFVPALFNVKGVNNYTIEVRNMHATLDFDLVKNWILINMAIVSYVENNKSKIRNMKKINLDDIVAAEMPGMANYLSKYIKDRKDLFRGLNINSEKFVYDPINNVTKEIPDINIKKVVIR